MPKGDRLGPQESLNDTYVIVKCTEYTTHREIMATSLHMFIYTDTWIHFTCLIYFQTKLILRYPSQLISDF